VEIRAESGLFEGYVFANSHEDGTLGEVFLAGFGKEGSTLEGWVQLSAVLFSIAIQYGAELPMIARKIAHMRFDPYGPTSDPQIPWCASVPGYVVHWLALRFGAPDLADEMRAIAEEMRNGTDQYPKLAASTAARRTEVSTVVELMCRSCRGLMHRVNGHWHCTCGRVEPAK
jgi:hypothetical protein